MSERECGKLTAEQFSAFIGKLPELRDGRQEMGRLLTKLSQREFDSLMLRNFNWGGIYEYSFGEHIAIAMIAFGQRKWFEERLGESR